MEMVTKRRFRSRQERRDIVEETLKPGASVSRVAREHDVNANQVFLWRRQYREGRFDDSHDSVGALVPVRVIPETGKLQSGRRQSTKPASSRSVGAIEIAWGSIRVRIEGAADPDSIRAVMDGLGR